MHICNWYHSDVTDIHYIHGYVAAHCKKSPCFLLSPFFTPLCSPFAPLYLLGTLLAVIGSVHLVPRLLVNWSSHFPPLAHIPLIPKSQPPLGFSRSKYTLIRATRETGSQDPAQLHTKQMIVLYMELQEIQAREYLSYSDRWLINTGLSRKMDKHPSCAWQGRLAAVNNKILCLG